MSVFIQVKISHDTEIDCLVNTDCIEMLRIHPNGKSCALYMYSGKVYGCNENPQEVVKASGHTVVVVKNLDDLELSDNFGIKEIAAPVVKQPSAVFTQKGTESKAEKKKKRRVIDNKAPSAVFSGGHKVVRRKISKIKKLPRQANQDVGSTDGVAVTVTMAEPSV